MRWVQSGLNSRPLRPRAAPCAPSPRRQDDIRQWRAKIAGSAREWAERNGALRREKELVARHYARLKEALDDSRRDAGPGPGRGGGPRLGRGVRSWAPSHGRACGPDAHGCSRRQLGAPASTPPPARRLHLRPGPSGAHRAPPPTSPPTRAPVRGPTR
jgi:hypothetical protein